mmetsp:Transcript_151901/g.487494  ORF Transcript_151901/g.487494 Transcript_151901/m.487494 type:complete len:579 (+) Transcript_151901:233-1969(+)
MVFRSRCRLSLLDGVAVGADPVSRLSPFALSRMALRASREQRNSVSLWRAIAARSMQLAPSMQPTDMSIVLFAFARLRLRDRDMMMRLAEATPAILGQFRAVDITFFLAAFARLDVQHKVIFNLFAREIARKLHDFTAAQLGELVYAYARLGLKHELLLDILKKRVIEVVKALKPWHLAMVVNGFARLGVQDERFFTVLAAEICRRISEFPGRPLALVANAYARLGVRNRFLLEVLGDEAFRRRGELEPQAVALVLNAHAKLQISNPVLFDYFAQDVPRRIKSYSMHSLCLVSSAFARAGRAEPALFQKVGDSVCSQAPSLYPRAVATMLFAFSEVDIRHGVLFYNAPEHVREHLARYSVDELAMIARAYGRFQMVHLPLFDTITSAIPTRTLVDAAATPPLFESGSGDGGALGDALGGVDSVGDEEAGRRAGASLPRVASLVWLMEAYARLTIFEAEILQLLCDAIVARRADLEPQMVVHALRAAAALSWAHDGLIALGADCLAEQSEDLTIEDLEQLAKSLHELGAAADEREAEDSIRLLERPTRRVSAASAKILGVTAPWTAAPGVTALSEDSPG